MESALKDKIILAISVVILSTLVSAISWTFVIGYSISSSFQNKIVSSYSEAGLSILIDFNNIANVDSVNLYRMLEINRGIIRDFSITNLDGSHTIDTRQLLNRPTDRFSVNIKGDPSSGFEVEMQEVVSVKAGN